MTHARTIAVSVLGLLLLLGGNAFAKAPTAAVVPPLSVAGDAAVGRHPEGVAIDPALRIAVVANRNARTVSLVSLDTKSEITKITTGLYPFGVAVNPVTHRAVVTNLAEGTVSVIDLVARRVEHTVKVGRHPMAVDVHAGRNRAYVANFNSNDVSVVDLAAGTLVATVKVGGKPAGIAVNATTNTAAVTSRADDTVTLLNIAGAQPTVAGIIDLPRHEKYRHQPIGVAFDASTNTLAVANHGSWTVSVLRLDASNDVIGHARVDVAKRPVAVAMVVGADVALATSDKDDVYAIDLQTDALVGRANVGRVPSGIAVDHDRCGAVVTNRVDNTVTFLGVRCTTVLRLTKIAPEIVTAGGQSFLMTLTGTGFVTGSVVNVGPSHLLPQGPLTPTSMTVLVPGSLLTVATTYAVSVQNPGGEVSNALTLTVTDQRELNPTLDSVLPQPVVADFVEREIVLNGTNFLPGAVVDFGGVLITQVTVDSSTQARAIIPGALYGFGRTVLVKLVNPGGGQTGLVEYKINNPLPILSLITPNNVANGSAAVNVVMIGNDFVLSSVVHFCKPATATTLEEVCVALPSTPFAQNPSVQINATIPGALLVIPPDSSDPKRFVYRVKVFNPTPGGGLSYEQPFTITDPTLPPGYAVTVLTRPEELGHPERVTILRAGTATEPTIAAAAYSDAARIDIIDVAGKTVLNSFTLQAGGLGDIDANRNTNTVVVPWGPGDKVFVIHVDPSTGVSSPPVAVSLPAGSFPFGVAVNPTTNQAIIVNLGTQDLSVLDLNTKTIAKTIALNGKGQIKDASFAAFIAVNPATNVSAVVDQNDLQNPGWVTLVNIATGAITGQVDIGVVPTFAAINDVTNRAVVANSFSDASLNDSVAVIDMGAGSLVATIALHEEPVGVAVDTATNTARVATQRSNQIFLVDLVALAIVDGDSLQLGVGDAVSPSDLAWDPAKNLLITTSATSNNYIIVESGLPVTGPAN